MDMLIAQLSVAGEDGAHPRPLQLDQSVDDVALEEFTCDRSNLPWVIFRAAHRANHISALPARSRALLAALARTVDANRPYAAIFARRELLTGRALQSMRTFYRSLDDLETAALIDRAPQKRHGDAGLFGRAYLHLTPKAAVLLGLVDDANVTIENEGNKGNQSSDHLADAQEPIFLAPPSATVADGAIYKDLYPKTQKRQPGSLPADLQRLAGLGFRQFLIFKLMREARLHAKRLSDVVEATWDYLSKASHPISYLRALLRSPVDFSHQVRTQRAIQQEQSLADARANAIDNTVRKCAGKVYFDTDNARRIDISDDASTLNVHDCREAKPRIGVGQWAADFVEALESGRIHAATDERERSFKKKCLMQPEATAAVAIATVDQVPRAATAAISERLAQMKRMLRMASSGNVPKADMGRNSLALPAVAS
jgi:hypothetical protein